MTLQLRKLISVLRALLICIISFSLVTPQISLASDCAANPKGCVDFFQRNDINFYDPNGSLVCRNNSTSDSNTGVVAGENLETILRFFTAKGFSLAAAAGIAGNMQQESGLNPNIIQGGQNAPSGYRMVSGVGYGLVQWTSGGRQVNLQKYADSKGKPISDITTQLEFTMIEMSSGYKDVYSRLNNEKADAVAAAIIDHGFTPDIRREGSNAHPKFLSVNPPSLGYEASGDTSSQVVNIRGGNAGKYYSDWAGKITDGTGVPDAETSTDTTNGGTTGSTASCGDAGTGVVGVGEGNFTDSGEVAGYTTVMANAQKTSAKWGDRFVSKGWCLAITSTSWQGIVAGGYPTAASVWQRNKDKLHKDTTPKKGAIMFSSGSGPAGHVFIYLENNKILNDGYITDANAVFGHGKGQWGNEYIGWIDPSDLGWKSVPISDNVLNNYVNRFSSHSGA